MQYLLTYAPPKAQEGASRLAEKWTEFQVFPEILSQNSWFRLFFFSFLQAFLKVFRLRFFSFFFQAKENTVKIQAPMTLRTEDVPGLA